MPLLHFSINLHETTLPSELSLYLGTCLDKNGDVSSNNMFSGDVDELRLYSRALTEKEIAEASGLIPNFKFKEAENGSVTLSYTKAPTETPKMEDFELSFTVEGKSVTPVIENCSYDAEKMEAVITFEPITNMNNWEKTVEVSVGQLPYCSSFKTFFATGTFMIPAGNNNAPVASDVQVTNLSPALGSGPHVKGMLEVEYACEDPDGDAEGKSETEYQWYIADEKDGEYTPLSGICTRTVILLDDYVGKYLKCEVKPADIHGNVAKTGVMSSASNKVLASEGNPLTDWFIDGQFGVAHHVLSEFVVRGELNKPENMWDRTKQTWDEFIGEFDAEKYAEQISKTGAKFVTITLGQNAAQYCAPNLVYDKYLREAGLLKEGEVNPKTVSFENDLPMKLANALEPYGIKVMLYLPSNVPHSAHWDDSKRDYLITEKALHGQRGSNGPNSQEAKKILCEMVEWWSVHYGDKIAGWWFDGMYEGGTLESQNDMSLKYNISSLANAAKAGNPYNIVSFNPGMSDNQAFAKRTEYHDYTAGECNTLNKFPTDGRWAMNSDDCQNFIFGCLGGHGWEWGSYGLGKTNDYVLEKATTAVNKNYVMQFDTYVNHKGEVDEEQLAQLIYVKDALNEKDWGVDKSELTDLIASAKAIDSKKYTIDSYRALQAAIEEAEASLDSIRTTEKLEREIKKLQSAIDGLRGSKNTLEYFLDQAKEHVANGEVDNCVESIQKLFEEAIAEGEALMTNEKATYEEVMKATVKLMKAIQALDMKAADKVDLAMAVDLAEAIDLSKYVEAGQVEFQKALTDAKAVLANGDAMQPEADAAWSALVDAISNLRLKADKGTLEDLLNSIKDLDLSKYTEESVAAFKAALKTAEAIMADESMSDKDQAKVDETVKDLQAALDGLKLASNDADNSGNINNAGNDSNANNGTSGNVTSDTAKNAPKTGDVALPFGMLALVVLAGGIVIISFRKKYSK